MRPVTRHRRRDDIRRSWVQTCHEVTGQLNGQVADEKRTVKLRSSLPAASMPASKLPGVEGCVVDHVGHLPRRPRLDQRVEVGPGARELKRHSQPHRAALLARWRPGRT